ncbi:hypothetical protein OPT61_g10625 [Boeremia exigua]|uniref:Uncharacterized protein n=1 Tax=Boeremia exigua TaxID=749465 RepID=A0ACC2HP64_9PLEO|nr:hypothetical protein OPT61_g10625 [Boeremia exigua]
MQKDNAHLDLDDYGSSGVLTPDGQEEYVLMEDAVDVEDTQADIADITATAADLDLDDVDSDVAEAKPHVQDTDRDDAYSAESIEAKPQAQDTDSSDDYASRSDIEARLSLETPDTAVDTPDPAPAPKIGAAAKKRAKKAAKQAETEQAASENKCSGCDAAFPSKTRLHDHLKKNPGHAALKSAPGGKRGKKR